MTLSRWTLFRFRIFVICLLWVNAHWEKTLGMWKLQTRFLHNLERIKPKYPFLYDRSQLWAHKRPWSLRGLIFKLKYSWVVQFKQASQMNARSSQHVVEVEPKPELERKPRSLNEERSSDVAATYNELGTHVIWKSHRPKWIVSP